MPGTAAKVFFTGNAGGIVASRTASVRLVQRAQIILLSYQKRNNELIGEVVGLNPQQVSVWRKHWKANQDRLIDIECTDTKAALQRAIETVLADLPRKGRDSRFTTEQQASIVAIACEEPDAESERPISHWTHQEIAEIFERSHQAFHRVLKHDNGPSLQMDTRRKAALQVGKAGSNSFIASPFNVKSKPRH